MMSRLGAVLIVVVAISGCNSYQQVHFRDNLNSNPTTSGWRLRSENGEEPAGSWRHSTSTENASLTATTGYWQSPQFRVNPQHYYRLTFYSKAEAQSAWSAIFTDFVGRRLKYDHRSGIDRSSTWRFNEFCFRAPANAHFARLRFKTFDGEQIFVKNIEVRRASLTTVAEWSDLIYSTLPPLKYEMPLDRWVYMPKTMEKLQMGDDLRILVCGCPDLAASPFDALLKRMYRNVDFTVLYSPGTEGKLERVPMVVADIEVQRPDLVIFGDFESAEVAKKALATLHNELKCEILILDNASEMQDSNEKDAAALKDFAEENSVAYLDLAKVWSSYLEQCGMPEGCFRSEKCSLDVRGKQVAARILELYFVPCDGGSPAAKIFRTFTDGVSHGASGDYSGCALFMLPSAWR